MDKTTVDSVNLSLGRCINKPDFLDTFYKNFIKSDHRIAAHFQNTDMKKQMSLLKQGLTFVVMAAGGSSFALKEIEKLGVLHDKQHLNVHPDLYSFWEKSLIETIKEFDKQFDVQLEKNWHDILQFGIKIITSYYNQASA